MKILFLTDTHHRGTTPQNRLDNFPDTQREKVQEVVELVREHQVDVVLHGGDFWDSPFPALNVCAEVLETYRAIPVPIYASAGNHDLYGHNLGTSTGPCWGLRPAGSDAPEPRNGFTWSKDGLAAAYEQPYRTISTGGIGPVCITKEDSMWPSI